MQRIVLAKQTRESRDLAKLDLDGIEETAAHGLPVEQHRAGAADTLTAAVSDVPKTELVVQDIQQKRIWCHRDLVGDTVDVKCHLLQAHSADALSTARCSASVKARRTNTLTRRRRYEAVACQSVTGAVRAVTSAATSSISAGVGIRPSRDERTVLSPATGRSSTPIRPRRTPPIASSPGRKRDVCRDSRDRFGAAAPCQLFEAPALARLRHLQTKTGDYLCGRRSVFKCPTKNSSASIDAGSGRAVERESRLRAPMRPRRARTSPGRVREHRRACPDCEPARFRRRQSPWSATESGIGPVPRKAAGSNASWPRATAGRPRHVAPRR